MPPIAERGAATGGDLVRPKTEDVLEAKTEEVADYSVDDERKPAGAGKAGPTRALPDYGDVIASDDEQEEKKPFMAVKRPGLGGDPLAKSEPRPEAIHVSGVQRLNKGHLEEVFASKALPQFESLEWIGDEQVLCIFASPKQASVALQGAEDGFGDTMAESKSPPGPGLWRAQRDMLDFREATLADVPDMGFKRQHRCGKQVREFRFWEAIKEVDRGILDSEDDRGQKRKLETICNGSNRAKVEGGGGAKNEGAVVAVQGDGVDLLEMMSQQDKKIFTGHEDPPDREDAWEDSWQEGRRGRGAGGDAWRQEGSSRRAWAEQSWGHDDRGQGRRNGGKGGGGGRRGAQQTGANSIPVRGAAVDAEPAAKRSKIGGLETLDNDEESSRRSKRNERFNL